MANLRIISAFLILSAVFMSILERQGKGLSTGQAPHGIVSLELAGDGERAGGIVKEWEAQGLKAKAIGNIRLDFLFIPFYSIGLYMLCGSLATWRSERPDRKGVRIAFGCLLAGLFDALENTLMLAGLRGHVSDVLSSATALFAGSKFVLLATAALYILYRALHLLLSEQSKAQSA